MAPTLWSWKEQLLDVSAEVQGRTQIVLHQTIVRLDSVKAAAVAAAKASLSASSSSSSSSNKGTSPFSTAVSHTSNRGNSIGSTTSSQLSIQTLLVPSRIIKIILLAIVVTELVDRVGILLYEQDVPTIVKTYAQNVWYSTIQPKLVRWKENIQRVYWNRIEPRLPPWLVEVIDNYSRHGANPLSSWLTTEVSPTKVAFAVGASAGMVVSPALMQWTYHYWRPIVGMYGVAEINHYCKRHGYNLVHWLGETPNTLGATVDGILEQCRSALRRAVFRATSPQQRQLQTYYDGIAGTNRPSFVAEHVDVRHHPRPTFFGGDGNMDRSGHYDALSTRSSSKSKRKTKKSGSSSITDDSDSQGLLGEIRGWTVLHHSNRHPDRQGLTTTTTHYQGYDGYYERTILETMVKRGFLLGCALGFAVVRI
jgi:hypothetical protein